MASCVCPTVPRPTSSNVPHETGARLLMPYLDVPGAEERFVATLYQSTGRTAQTYDPPELEQRGRTRRDSSRDLARRYPLDGERAARRVGRRP